MRFNTIEDFKVESLKLDEGNYRFLQANDEDDCIYKIFTGNRPYFKNLVESIAVDDLGEPLLVYKDPNGSNIVLDGNRRAAAIKVLFEPERAPTRQLQKFTEEMASKTDFDFDNIQAQVSSDKELILKTVYERHAAGQGKSRIDWNALAAAKFRFDTEKSEKHDWYGMALIMELEAIDPAKTEYVYTKAFSFEVFRRLIRAGVSKGHFAGRLFAKNGKRLVKRHKKDLQDAIDLVCRLLEKMQSKKISLSRSETFADKNKIDELYAELFPRHEEQVEDQDDDTSEGEGNDDKDDADQEEADGDEPPGNGANDDSFDSDTDAGGDGSPAPSEDEDDTEGSEDGEPGEDKTEDEDQILLDEEGEEEINVDATKPKSIKKSNAVAKRLNELGSFKLSALYRSMIELKFSRHSAAVTICAWAFWETLARNLGMDDKTSFDSFLNGKINIWYSARGEKNSMKQSLKYISDEGNCNKHCRLFVTMNAEPLTVHFQVLEPLLIKCLDELIANKSLLS